MLRSPQPSTNATLPGVCASASTSDTTMPSPATRPPPPSETLSDSTKRPPEQEHSVSRSKTVLNSTTPLRCISPAGVSCSRSLPEPTTPPGATAAPRRSV
jgi:hypothetical protein